MFGGYGGWGGISQPSSDNFCLVVEDMRPVIVLKHDALTIR